MRGIVRTGVDATGFLEIGAQIAGGSFLFDDRFAAPGMLGVFTYHLERMEVDISVRAIACAQATADAPILDDHFERIAAPNSSHRTTHHAQRVAALAARRGHQKILKAQPFADESRHAIV